MSLLLVPGLCQRGCGDAIKRHPDRHWVVFHRWPDRLRALQVASAALPAQARAQGSSTAVTSTTTRSSTSSASRTSDTSSTTSDGSSRTSSGTSSPSASPSDNAAAGFVDKNWAPWMLAYVAGVGLAL
ncbi:uncharacterized protein ATNIH1004_001944 [Aspergillus tanneri]|uniref:Uncharacterized protein n=1 Tax=Aspergillus tanneri TaxID=1220188 RepID=A0A5M9MAA5_9EURO|nr:uncharacterized protein ATNIH1004_001944 [Aspergillus tanneri]KAA8641479.1 hypothetical protein ATNIH1004_001944 [Aspergillus tanneri]